MSQVHYDEGGFLRGFPYHDGSFDGVLVTGEGKEVHLALRDVSGGRRVVRLGRVAAFCVDGFRQGNIVYDLRVIPKARIHGDKEAVRMIRERLGLDPAKLHEDELVFLLDTSYGADVVAICREVEVHEGKLAPLFAATKCTDGVEEGAAAHSSSTHDGERKGDE